MFRRVGCILVPLSYKLCTRGYQKSLQKSLFEFTVTLQPRLLAPPSFTMASSVTPDKVLKYDDILNLIESKDMILIDVREPHELEQDGKIPSSTNIPLNDVAAALQLSANDFENKYGIPLPSKDAPLVFHCRAGGRSAKALLAALDLGFINSKHYGGGMLDWMKNTCGK